jgi:hypothetical protein
MLWAYLKIILSLAIPLCTIGYAREVQRAQDVQILERTMQQPLNFQRSFSHPSEALRQSRAEIQYIQRLIADLDN